jgi:hypothetical protein
VGLEGKAHVPGEHAEELDKAVQGEDRTSTRVGSTLTDLPVPGPTGRILLTLPELAVPVRALPNILDLPFQGALRTNAEVLEHGSERSRDLCESDCDGLVSAHSDECCLWGLLTTPNKKSFWISGNDGVSVLIATG